MPPPPVSSSATISASTASYTSPNSLFSSSNAYASTPMPSGHPQVSETSHLLDTESLTDHDEFETARLVTIPQCSTWFAMDKINPIEKRMLPEFFMENGSKTAELYLKYRNYMIHASRHQPEVYLTATACRRHLTGDACAILRVHEFLTHWGLINFHVPPHAMPRVMHSNYSLKTVEMTTKTQEQGPIARLQRAQWDQKQRDNGPLPCEACGRPRGMTDSFFGLTNEAKKKFMSAGSVMNGASTNALSTGTNGKNNSDDKEVTVRGFALRPGSGICEDCYIRGAFPEGYEASEFVLMPSLATSYSAAAQWTEEETNLMLDAVSSTRNIKIKDVVNEEDEESCDWNYVASKVGSKTAEECLLHFLELPMLDQSVPTQRTTLRSSIQSLQPYSAGEALNAPVLDLAALVKEVDPLVAKAAAHAAIKAIKQLHTMPVTSTTTSPLETSVNEENTDAKDAAKAPVKSLPSVSGPTKISDSSSSSLDDAVAAVVTSAEVAGIGSTIKFESFPGDNDVVMDNVSIMKMNSKPNDDNARSVSKEMIAVIEEAANATTIALLATRCEKLADDVANGPVRDLVMQLLENQLRQMELKMQQMDVLEQAIIAEKEELAKEKYQLYVDRLSFAREKMKW